MRRDLVVLLCQGKERPGEVRGRVWFRGRVDLDGNRRRLQAGPLWLIGKRDRRDCYTFLSDLRSRLQPGRIQITTDGLASYLKVIEPLFGADRTDYAQLIKSYESTQEEIRYSPAVHTATEIRIIIGDPDPAHISTSYVERQNLTMRMGMRRFTRLTNGFSKKVENHAHAVSLHFMHYNFGRPHQTLTKQYGKPTTPAMAAGVADHVWSVWEIAGLLD
jgi:IS1 family transposase